MSAVSYVVACACAYVCACVRLCVCAGARVFVYARAGMRVCACEYFLFYMLKDLSSRDVSVCNKHFLRRALQTNMYTLKPVCDSAAME